MKVRISHANVAASAHFYHLNMALVLAEQLTTCYISQLNFRSSVTGCPIT